MMASLRSVDRNLSFSLLQSAIGHQLPPYVILVDGGLSHPSGRASRRPPEIFALLTQVDRSTSNIMPYVGWL